MAGGADHSAPLAFSCDCGALRGEISPAGLRHGTHVECFCADCRAVELYHRQPDPAPGPVGLFQTAAHHVRFLAGRENLALLRLSPNGLMRWYAGCCGTPMFNTLSKPTISFAALRRPRIDEPDRLGPVSGRAFVPRPEGGKPRMEGMAPVLWGFGSRVLAARLSGKWRDTPFFDATGVPVAAARVLTKEERSALYPERPGGGA